MRSSVAWAAGLGLVVAAWAVAAATPGDELAEEPFRVAASVGERAEGRNIAVTVTDVRAADTVTAANGWTADGTWVVVDLEVEAVASEQGTALTLATLTIGDRTYGASERPESLARQHLSVGGPRTGSLAFEVAEGALEGDGMLHLGVSADPRLDSLIELPVDLDDLTVESATELVATEWSER